MPEREFIITVPGVKVYDVIEDAFIVLKGRAEVNPETCCPTCESKNYRIKATTKRWLKYGTLCRKLIWLELKNCKLYCKRCGRYFMNRIPGILPWKRATELFRQEVFQNHFAGQTQTYLSKTLQISNSTVERWYKDYVVYRVKELSGRSCPTVLGIDEHFFSRKKGYATTFVDLKNHKVFDVALGRYEKDLRSYLKALPGRDKVKVVVIDMSNYYRGIVRKYFPNAMVVSDRFHVIRWVNHQFLAGWKEIEPEGRENRGIMRLMRKHEWKLTEKQEVRLKEYLNDQPAVKAIYDFKQGLNKLLLRKDIYKSEAPSLISQYLWHMNELLNSPIEAFQKLGRTLRKWQKEIVRMWRFSKTNGITEGLHTKMEMISRRAFGFRNFENYRLRVIALCGWDGVFTVRN